MDDLRVTIDREVFTDDPYPELPRVDRRDLELGRFIHKFAQLELTVAIVTWAAIGVSPEAGPTVPLPLGLGRTLDFLKGIAAVRFDADLADRLVGWADRVGRLAKRRNVLAHSPWLSGDDTEDEGELRQISITKPPKDRISATSLTELRGLCREALALSVEGGSELWFRLLDAQGYG